ncbi:RNA polymerase sigma factor [Paenibacillus chungangensis]|uniref:RNA polymerase sigma factor n=1 Tax=Paenibacillus chungangensis TaxID=696535 RepID=A0ABW3HWE1_9BACL
MDGERHMVDELKKGSESALQALMKQYGNAVMRTAALLLKDGHLAQDVSQEVFLKAYERIGQYRGEGSLRAWLLQITVNQCRGRMRRASWKRLLFRSFTDERKPDEAVESGNGLSDSQAALEPGSPRQIRELSLRQEIGKLELAYREVVVLYYYDELSVKEIADVLQLSEPNVKSRLHRARQALKVQLEEGGWSDEYGTGRTAGSAEEA